MLVERLALFIKNDLVGEPLNLRISLFLVVHVFGESVEISLALFAFELVESLLALSPERFVDAFANHCLWLVKTNVFDVVFFFFSFLFPLLHVISTFLPFYSLKQFLVVHCNPNLFFMSLAFVK